MSAWETLLESLIKYPLDWFAQGELGLSYSIQFFLVLAVAAALLALGSARLALGAWRPRQDILTLGTLRWLALILILLCLFQPVLLLPDQTQQRGMLAVLLDDSLSMTIEDLESLGGDNTSRADFIRRHFGPQGDIAQALNENFDLSLFRFGADVETIQDSSSLSFSQAGTNLADALRYVEQTLSGAPLAGVVVVSDGAVNSGTALQEAILRLTAAGTPIYTLGVGQERFPADLEISAVQLPAKALKDTTVQANVQIQQRGYGSRETVLSVFDGEQILVQQTITLSDSTLQTLTLPLRLSEGGPKRLRFELPQLPDETLTANNHREIFLEVLDRREKILYVEGAPRFELKFLRRAVADAPNLHVVTLVRTGDSKFYRLGIDSPEQLQDGFPESAEELFEYRGIIIGSVEASFFSDKQQALLLDFMDKRGGGVLFLGGKLAFAEGGYADSQLAQAMPVVMGTPSSSFQREVTMLPTALGRNHAISQLASTEADSWARWQDLPAVSVVNPLDQNKPGATTLLQETVSPPSSGLLGLVYQRYGRGLSVALPLQNTWLWQMHADVPLDDYSHETFWRQLLSWLVSETPQRIELPLSANPLIAHSDTSIPIQVYDAQYDLLSGAVLRAKVLGPSGDEQNLVASELIDAPGTYSLPLRTSDAGLYELHIETDSDDVAAAGLNRIAYLHASAAGEEYYRSELQTGVLRQLASESGGTYFGTDSAERLPRAIRPAPTTASLIQRYELWDMPLLLLLLLLTLSLDWGYRRWRGLR